MARTYKNNSTKTRAEKDIKKLPVKGKICIFLFFLIGLAVSYFAMTTMCKNDYFIINGTKNITVTLNDSYIDAGASAVAFGKDAKDKIQIEVYENNTLVGSLDKIDTSKEATYQIVYTVSSIRFKDIKLIRVLNVIPEEVEI